MKSLQIKSIIVIIIAILTSTNVFSQDQVATTQSTNYTDKAEFFEGQNTRILKTNFIGNFIGTTKISYEQVLKPGRSFEIKTTLIEMGEDGFIGSVGYKFYRKPTFVAPNMQRRHILEGTYFKPEIFVGMTKDENLLETSDESEATLGVVLNIGKQWILGDFFAIDTYFGTGLGTGNHIRGYLAGEGLVLTAGINFGFAF